MELGLSASVLVLPFSWALASLFGEAFADILMLDLFFLKQTGRRSACYIKKQEEPDGLEYRRGKIPKKIKQY